MAALTAGTKAPDFELKAMDGKRFSLQEELTHRPVVLAFFKGHVRCANTHFRFWTGCPKPTAGRMSHWWGSRRTIPKPPRRS